MQLDLLPSRSGSAAENMALDFLLLQRYPQPRHARFRHYDWHRPAFTFGYGQTLDYVRARLPAGEAVELCRRPTGGGLVDHRFDWTYTLVIPFEHDLYETRAADSYRLVHACIADAFRSLGQEAVLKEPDPATAEKASGPGVCFNHAENFDVIHPGTGAKIAGAAQKRSKQGMLFQGSISRGSVAATLDWDCFSGALVSRLSAAMGADAQPCPWPDFPEEMLAALVDQYSSEEWTACR